MAKVPPADVRGNALFEEIWEKSGFGPSGESFQSTLNHVDAFSNVVLSLEKVTAHAHHLAKECLHLTKWVRSHLSDMSAAFDLGGMFKQLEHEVSGERAMAQSYSSGQRDPGAGRKKKHAQDRARTEVRDLEIEHKAETLYLEATKDEQRKTKYIADELEKEYSSDEKGESIHPLIQRRPLENVVRRVLKRLKAKKTPGS
jgi:hypothetical protein